MFLMSVFDPGFTLEHYDHFFRQPTYFRVLIETFKMAASVTIICFLLGYPLAYLMANAPPRTTGLLMIMVVLPFFTAILVRTYAWMVILGRNGILNQILLQLGLISDPLKMMHNKIGVYVGMIQILLPPGVGGGCLLVFIISLGFYITPALLGGISDVMISMFIETQVNSLLNWGFASALAFILLVLTLILFYFYNRFFGLDRLIGGR
jgi:ABC-type spermidine/putrescine transport system permease subunit I